MVRREPSSPPCAFQVSWQGGTVRREIFAQLPLQLRASVTADSHLDRSSAC